VNKWHWSYRLHAFPVTQPTMSQHSTKRTESTKRNHPLVSSFWGVWSSPEQLIQSNSPGVEGQKLCEKLEHNSGLILQCTCLCYYDCPFIYAWSSAIAFFLSSLTSFHCITIYYSAKSDAKVVSCFFWRSLNILARININNAVEH